MYKNKKRNFATKKDNNNRVLLAYDMEDGIVKKETEGILKEIDAEIGKEISKFYNINLADYGVEIISETIITS